MPKEKSHHHQHKPRKKYKREFIDFRTLDKRGLRDLADKWETDARIFEAKLQSYMFTYSGVYKEHANEEKVERLWGVGKSLWRRVEILEQWKRRNKIKV